MRAWGRNFKRIRSWGDELIPNWNKFHDVTRPTGSASSTGSQVVQDGADVHYLSKVTNPFFVSSLVGSQGSRMRMV